MLIIHCHALVLQEELIRLLCSAQLFLTCCLGALDQLAVRCSRPRRIKVPSVWSCGGLCVRVKGGRQQLDWLCCCLQYKRSQPGNKSQTPSNWSRPSIKPKVLVKWQPWWLVVNRVLILHHSMSALFYSSQELIKLWLLCTSWSWTMFWFYFKFKLKPK